MAKKQLSVNWLVSVENARECTEEELNDDVPIKDYSINCSDKMFSHVLSFLHLAIKGIHMANERGAAPNIFRN